MVREVMAYEINGTCFCGRNSIIACTERNMCQIFVRIDWYIHLCHCLVSFDSDISPRTSSWHPGYHSIIKSVGGKLIDSLVLRIKPFSRHPRLCFFAFLPFAVSVMLQPSNPAEHFMTWFDPRHVIPSRLACENVLERDKEIASPHCLSSDAVLPREGMSRECTTKKIRRDWR